MTIILSDTAVAPKSAPMLMPIEGLGFFNYLGGSAADSIKNEANAAAPFTVVGSPTYGERYARCKSVTSGAYLNTGITPGNEWTIMVVGHPDLATDLSVNGDNPGGLLSNFASSSGSLIGIGIGWAFASLRFSYATDGTERFLSGITPTGDDRFLPRFLAFRGKYGDTMIADDLTSGGHVSEAAVAGTPNLGNVPLRAGSTGNGTNRYGYSWIYWVGYVPVKITDQELQRVYWQVKRSLLASETPVAI